MTTMMFDRDLFHAPQDMPLSDEQYEANLHYLEKAEATCARYLKQLGIPCSIKTIQKELWYLADRNQMAHLEPDYKTVTDIMVFTFFGAKINASIRFCPNAYLNRWSHERIEECCKTMALLNTVPQNVQSFRKGLYCDLDKRLETLKLGDQQ